MKNIPQEIFLQVDADGETPEDFKELQVTWASDKVYDNDLVYVHENEMGRRESMENYVKEVLIWLLTKSSLGEIVMYQGDLYYEEDKDGDAPIGIEQIIKLYENDREAKGG